jgi:hypothetical protein
MTAAELTRAVRGKLAHDIEPILARALAEERNRALEEATEACDLNSMPGHTCGQGSCHGACWLRILALKTDPAEIGR